MITESCANCKHFFIILYLKYYRQQNKLYPAKRQSNIHNISMNVFGIIMEIIMPTAIQNKENPITFLFTTIAPCSFITIYYASSSKMFATSSSVNLPSFFSANLSITSGIISRILVIVS